MEGRQLGHYRLEGLLGRGGMGEVHRAVDTRLDREVAVKLLPPDLATDAERLARFEREARVLASLNHPNIAQIFDVETSGDDKFLVMELAEGEDLSDRIARGAISWSDAHRIAGQIAAGLAEAHEKGIVHRDLKPQNVKVTPDGNVKILDFGLARAVEETGQADLTQSPTITAAMTGQGVVLGTAAYMSPEQARGLEADRRADVWAFGVILFEMLTGNRLFHGDTVSDTIAAVLTRDPEWEDLPEDLPGPTRYLLRRALVRDRDRRLRDVGEAEALLTDPDTTSSFQILSASDLPEIAEERKRRPWPALALAAIAVVFAVMWFRGTQAPVPAPAPYASDVVRITFQSQRPSWPELSPDGAMVAYSTGTGPDADIFLQRLGGTKPINLTGDAARNWYPVFSPSGDRIAFNSARDGTVGIYVMGATGEAARLVVANGSYPAWSPDGVSLAYTSEVFTNPYGRISTSSLWIVDVDGGEPRKVFDGDAVQVDWSPSGEWLVFWSVNVETGGQRDIFAMRPDGSGLVALLDDAAIDWSPKWSSDGRTVYFLSDRGGPMNLWRIGFDPERGVPEGNPVAVTLPASIVMAASISADGSTVVYQSVARAAEWRRIPFDRASGTLGSDAEVLPFGNLTVTAPRLSPDGESVAFVRREFQEDVMVASLDGSDIRQLTDDAFRDRGPSWSPDGSRIFFYTDRSGEYEVYSARIDGSDRQRVTQSPEGERGPVWYPVISDSGEWMAGTNTNGSAICRKQGDGWMEPTLLEPPGGDMFLHFGWAPGEDRILGVAATGFGAPGPIVIYDPVADVWTETGIETTAAILAWVDPRRILYNPDNQSVRILDLGTGEDREFLSGAVTRELTSILVPREGDWVLTVNNRTSADIWAARLVEDTR